MRKEELEAKLLYLGFVYSYYDEIKFRSAHSDNLSMNNEYSTTYWNYKN